MDTKQAFDTTNIQRKVWLVKIPAGVSEAWSHLPAGSELGTVKIFEPQNTNQPKTMSLCLQPAEPPSEGVQPKTKRPRMVSQYKLAKMAQRDERGMLVFSEDTTGHLAMEGMVDERVDAQPEISAEYKALMEARQMACRPDKETMMYTETGRERYMVNIFSVKAPPTMKADPLDKRVRMEKADLQAKLFELFQLHQYYRIQHLVDKTQQPLQWLKEVLKEIAVHHVKGDHKSEWELKKEYQAYTAEDGA